MICPRCGQPNPDSAAECSKCFHKFSFGHGYGDPAKREYGNVNRGLNNIFRDTGNPMMNFIVKAGVVLLIITFVLPLVISFFGFLF